MGEEVQVSLSSCHQPDQRVDTRQRIQSWTYSTGSCIDLLMLCTCDIYLGISTYTIPVPSRSSAGALAVAFFTLWVTECGVWVLKQLCCTKVNEEEKPTTIVANNKREFYGVRPIINKSILGHAHHSSTIYSQKFGFIKRVDKGWITTVKDLESWRFER